VAAIFSPIKADFPLMNGREYYVNGEIRESKWGFAGDGHDQETDYLPVRAIFVKPHANRSQLFLLPTVHGAFEPSRKLLRAGHRPSYEFYAAFLALRRSRILSDRLTSACSDLGGSIE
jgi:hypothetical protein